MGGGVRLLLGLIVRADWCVGLIYGLIFGLIDGLIFGLIFGGGGGGGLLGCPYTASMAQIRLCRADFRADCRADFRAD